MTSTDMKNFQKQARKSLEDGKGIDVAAVILGWNIGAGTFENSIIEVPEKNLTIKIEKETGHRQYQCTVGDKSYNFSGAYLAKIILSFETVSVAN